ncbi:MAG: histidine kinase dimerization/phosphoacceptor domain -containing protein [Bacteroidota bacterium]
MKSIFLVSAIILACITPNFAQKTVFDSLYQLGRSRTASGDVPGATEVLLAAQKIAEKEHDSRKLCGVEITLGKIGLISENNKAAEKAAAQAETDCTACRDSASLGRLFLLKGILQIKYAAYDSAILYFKRSTAFYTSVRDTMGAANASAKIGNVLEQQGKYQEAQPYYLKFYEVANASGDSARMLTANIYLTGNYHYLKQTQKALFHNEIVKSLSKKLNGNYEYAQALRYDALIYEQMGRYKEAYYRLFNYLHFNEDTLMSAQNLKQAEEMRSKYEAEKKETLIALQESQLGRERLRFWAVLGGLALAIFAGGFLSMLAQRLRKRNEEKEFLIKEIHHRVKNNLQILSSLLHLQSRQITDDAALDAVREGQHRVDAMGLIHQKLYMGDNMAKVEMKDYLEQFGQNMLDSFGIEDERIKLVYDLEPMYLDVDTAIPLGLIINELVTNSFKYAFPDNKSGAITIALWKDDKNRLCLQVSDNGVGQHGAIQDPKGTSFGTNLVQMLSKKLKGKPEVLAQEAGYGTFIAFEQVV